MGGRAGAGEEVSPGALQPLAATGSLPSHCLAPRDKQETLGPPRSGCPSSARVSSRCRPGAAPPLPRPTPPHGPEGGSLNPPSCAERPSWNVSPDNGAGGEDRLPVTGLKDKCGWLIRAGHPSNSGSAGWAWGGAGGGRHRTPPAHPPGEAAQEQAQRQGLRAYRPGLPAGCHSSSNG